MPAASTDFPEVAAMHCSVIRSLSNDLDLIVRQENIGCIFNVSTPRTVMGPFLLIIAGAIFIYWLAGAGAPVAQKPAVFHSAMGPFIILAAAIFFAILGVIAW